MACSVHCEAGKKPPDFANPFGLTIRFEQGLGLGFEIVHGLSEVCERDAVAKCCARTACGSTFRVRPTRCQRRPRSAAGAVGERRSCAGAHWRVIRPK